MKQVFAIALSATSVFFLQVAHSQEAGVINYTGSLQLSEITVSNDGAQKTYDIPTELSSEIAFTSEGKYISFGQLPSMCQPFLGVTVAELRILVANVEAVVYGDSSHRMGTTIKTPRTGIIVVPAKSEVYGTCGKDRKTLTELSIRASNGVALRFDEAKD